MATRKIEVIITGDAKSLERALGKAGDNGKSFAKTMGKAGVAGAVLGLGAAVKIGVGEFLEAQKVTAQTNAVLKSTGGVANVTTKQVQGLSEALMRKSGVDDEAIQSGQNMLLTFTKIRNETGKGNDIFDQATKSTLNLSVAMGKDMQSSALLLGKALNDPIKGMASLGRAGVQFTEDQKDMIKGLVEGASAARALSTVIDEKLTPAQYKQALALEKSGMGIEDIAKKLNLEFTPAQMLAAQELAKGGKTMEAQKIILKELETQFGGSAEAAGKTFGGQINIAKQRLTNLAGEMVGKSIPALQAMFEFLNEHLVPVLKDLGETFTRVWQGIAKVLKENEAEINEFLLAVKTNMQGIAAAAKFLEEKVITPFLLPLFSKLLPLAMQDTIIKFRGLAVIIETVQGLFEWFKEKGAATMAVLAKASEKPLAVLGDAWKVIASAVGKVVDGVEWLIDHIPKMPKLPDLTPGFSLPGRGDAHDPNKGTGFNLMGASPVMAPFAAGAAGYGLQVTSGFRPGAITANGTPSDHGAGKAIDVSNGYNTPQMAAFFQSLIGNSAVKQAFYDPLGSIFGGKWSSYREGGHSDHVHVATYDKGGLLMPGLTLAYNGTGRPEQVVGPGGGGPIYLVLPDGKVLGEVVRKENAVYDRANL